MYTYEHEYYAIEKYETAAIVEPTTFSGSQALIDFLISPFGIGFIILVIILKVVDAELRDSKRRGKRKRKD